MPGSLHTAYRACGKPTCRCAQGQLHGPYWYRRWRQGRRQRRAYVREADLLRVRAAVELWHRLHPPLEPIRRTLAALARVHRAAGGLP